MTSLRLSKMILDKSLNGVLDQGADQLILFEESTEDVAFFGFST